MLPWPRRLSIRDITLTFCQQIMTKDILNDLLKTVRVPVTLYTMAIAIAFLTLTGPFGTYDNVPLGFRFSYWALVVVTAAAMALSIEMALSRLRPEWAFLLRSVVATMLMILFYTPILWNLGHLLTGKYREVSSIWAEALYVALATLAIYTYASFWRRMRPRQAPNFAERAGVSEANPIQHVTAEDHYVQVRTLSGTQRLLMRFSDALEQLQGLDGLQVHRSHWVSRAAIRRLDKRGSRFVIVLDDESEIPVSRGFQPSVVAGLAAAG